MFRTQCKLQLKNFPEDGIKETPDVSGVSLIIMVGLVRSVVFLFFGPCLFMYKRIKKG